MTKAPHDSQRGSLDFSQWGGGIAASTVSKVPQDGKGLRENIRGSPKIQGRNFITTNPRVKPGARGLICRESGGALEGWHSSLPRLGRGGGRSSRGDSRENIPLRGATNPAPQDARGRRLGGKRGKREEVQEEGGEKLLTGGLTSIVKEEEVQKV